MISNVFSGVPDLFLEELFQSLVKTPHVRVERIISRGHTTPPGEWYDQEQNEWVLLIKGAAKVRFENDLIEMKPGDFIDIPAHQRHRVEWTTPDEATIWLAVFYE